MQKVIQLLKDTPNAVIATSAADKPRASIIDIVVVNGAIIMSTPEPSIKNGNLKRNHRMSLSVQNLPRFATIDGTVTPAAPAEVAAYNAELHKRHPQFGNLLKMVKMSYYKIVPEKAYYKDFSKGDLSPIEEIKP